MTVTASTLTLNPYPNGKDNTQRRTIYNGTVAIGASPLTYASGGVPVSWASLSNAAAELFTEENSTPIEAWFESVSGSGYWYVYNVATSKLQIFVGGASASLPAAELAAGAVPAGVSGDSIVFHAEFARAHP